MLTGTTCAMLGPDAILLHLEQKNDSTSSHFKRQPDTAGCSPSGLCDRHEMVRRASVCRISTPFGLHSHFTPQCPAVPVSSMTQTSAHLLPLLLPRGTMAMEKLMRTATQQLQIH